MYMYTYNIIYIYKKKKIYLSYYLFLTQELVIVYILSSRIK